MKINHLEIKNFGRHKNIVIKDLPNVYGIIGKNGSGKSTILKAIGLSFGEKLPDQNYSWVRAGEKDAYVKVKFTHQEMEWCIETTIGKNSSKRTLEGNGIQIKKAAEIDQKLTEILGVDKHALQNSAFLSQGEIDKILSATPSEKIAMFAKLQNLNYLENVYRQIDAKLSKLKNSVKDYEEDRKTQQDILIKYRDQYNDIIKTLQSYCSNLQYALTYISSYKNLSEELEQKEKCYNTSLTEYHKKKEQANAYNSASLYEKEKSLSTEKKEIETILHDFLSLQAKFSARDQIGKQIEDLKTKIKEIENTKRNFDIKDFQAIQQKIKQYQEDLNTFLKIYWSKKTIEENNQKIKENKKEVEAIEEKLAAVPAIEFDRIENNIDSTSTHISTLKNSIELKRKLLDFQRKHDCSDDKRLNCPTCKLNISLDDNDISEQNIIDTESQLQKLEKKLIEYQEYKKKLEDDRNKLSSLLNSYERDIEKKRTENTQCESTLKENSFNIEESKNYNSIEDFQKIIQKLEEDERTLEKEHDLRDRLKTAQKQFDDITVLDDDWERFQKINDPKKFNEECNSKIEKLDKEINEIKSQLQQYQKVENELQKFKADVENDEREIKRINKSIQELEIPENYDKITEYYGTTQIVALELNIQSDLENVRKLEQDRDVQYSLIEQTRHQLDTIDNKIKENEILISTIKRLEKIKELFSKNGLAKIYLQKIFAKITNVTQHYLSTLNADFTITADNEKELSFKFKQFGNNDDHWLPDSKLSGGQKVRLSIAFALANQQIGLQGIDFVILDEPSTHLDDEGKESLREIIELLTQKSKNTNKQMIIVDHSKELETAFESTLKL